MKKQTALQQLIEQLEEQYKSTPVFGIQYAIRKATELLETEREQIEDAYTDGVDFRNEMEVESYSGCDSDAEQYYKETYG